jgi:hypothetical protein
MLIAAKHEEVSEDSAGLDTALPRRRCRRALPSPLLACLAINSPPCTLAMQEMHPSVLDFTNIADNCFMVGCPCIVACGSCTNCPPPL